MTICYDVIDLKKDEAVSEETVQIARRSVRELKLTNYEIWEVIDGEQTRLVERCDPSPMSLEIERDQMEECPQLDPPWWHYR